MKNVIFRTAVVCCAFVFGGTSVFCQGSDAIRINQIGFYPGMSKIAVVRTASAGKFFVVSAANSDTVFHGMLTAPQVWPCARETVCVADFTTFRKSGEYRLIVPGIGATAPFEIKEHVHAALAAGALKSYYYQRASIPLLPKYAGPWARAEGHPDTAVLVHASAASAQRPAGTKISSPGGWYDAGDYNKYIVNSGISTYTLLAAYEWYPEYCKQLSIGIPETGNGIPDLINESLWNVRWMLTMQDPTDGGVYSKCTDTTFDDFEMPWKDTLPRYVVMKTTAAALDFAAVMAQTARITAALPASYRGLSDSCKQAAIDAWIWARRNPSVYYNQPAMNDRFSPKIVTGAYADDNVSDEFAWAAAELFVTTRQDSFLTAANPLSAPRAVLPQWASVRTLGLFTLAKYSDLAAAAIDTAAVRSRILQLADSLRTLMNASAYRVVMGNDIHDFLWGSNGVAANQAFTLVIAYKLTGDRSYLNAALGNLDYLLGRNGTMYSFVTGFGSRPPMHIHHRLSGADGVTAPVPGLLAGGPNPDMQDHAPTYPSTLPALAYSDDQRSYASNEIAINWNAALVFVTIGIDADASSGNLMEPGKK